jgi:hypothetical protein
VRKLVHAKLAKIAEQPPSASKRPMSVSLLQQPSLYAICDTKAIIPATNHVNCVTNRYKNYFFAKMVEQAEKVAVNSREHKSYLFQRSVEQTWNKVGTRWNKNGFPQTFPQISLAD